MDYILVTVSYGDDKEDDLKVPAFLPVGELIDLLNEIYSTNGRTLHAQPKGIILDKKKTLQRQSIEHGAKLTLG